MKAPVSGYLLCVSSFLTGGCASLTSAPAPAILSTSVGPRLKTLWDAHGGVTAWQRFGGVTFSLSVETPQASFQWPQLALRFDQPDTVWVGVGEPGLAEGADRAPPTVWRAFFLGHAPGQIAAAGLRKPGPETIDEGVLDFSLRSIGFLFHLPFSLAGAGWELRTLIAPRGVEGPWVNEFEAMPRVDAGLLGPFLVRVTHRDLQQEQHLDGDRSESFLYLSRHPVFPAGAYEVHFEEFREIQGILVAMIREHRCRLPRRPREPRDPLRPELDAPPEVPPPVVRERLGNIRFLSAEEVEAIGLGEEEEGTSGIEPRASK